MEFSRPEDCRGQPFPSPRGLPNPGMEPRSPTLRAESLPPEPPGKPKCHLGACQIWLFRARPRAPGSESQGKCPGDGFLKFPVVVGRFGKTGSKIEVAGKQHGGKSLALEFSRPTPVFLLCDLEQVSSPLLGFLISETAVVGAWHRLPVRPLMSGLCPLSCVGIICFPRQPLGLHGGYDGTSAGGLGDALGARV